MSETPSTARYVVVPTETGVSRIVRQDGTPLATPGTLATLPPPAKVSSKVSAFHASIMASVKERKRRAVVGNNQHTPAGRRLREGELVPLAEQLRARRHALGLGQRELAAAAGISRGLLADVEVGRRVWAETRAHLGDVLLRLEQEALEREKAG